MAETKLDGKVVMMTGAGRGMGREMSIGLAGAGAKVAMIDIDQDVLHEAAGEVEKAGGQGAALPMVADVTSADNAATAVQKTIDQYGRIDVLVNDAVVGPERIGPDFFNEKVKFWDLDDGLWRQMLDVNIYGPQLMARTVVPHMLERGWGRIVNITTSLDTMYLAGAGAYGPTKAALEAHSRVMAQDLEGTGIGVNILIPGGPVNTRMIPENTGIPREALIQPDVMVDPVIWLSSNESDGTHCMRIIAALWDTGLDIEARLEKAAAPIAWTQIESRSIYPEY